MDSAAVVQEDDITSSTNFVPRRRPQPPQHSSSSSNYRRSTSRPHSIGALIISNPKLVKGWQYYDNSPHQRDIQKYFSTVNLGTSTSTDTTTFLEQGPNDTTSSGGGTGTRSGGSGDRRSFIQNRSLGNVEGGGNPEDREAVQNLATGVEIKACVAEEEDRGCSSAVVQIWSPVLGIFLAVVASSCIALSSVFMDHLGSYQYSRYSVLLWTSQGLLWPSFVLLLCPCQMRSVTLTKSEIPRSAANSKLVTVIFLLLRAVNGWSAAILSLESLHYLSSDNSTMIYWTAPIFVLPFAWLLLREKPGVVPSITALLVILGVGGIVRPSITGGVSVDKNFFVGCSLAGGAMILEGVLSVVILRHVRHVHFALVTFMYGLVGIGGGIIFYFVEYGPFQFQFPVGGQDTLQAVVICVLVFLGQTGITAALKFEQAGIFAVVSCWQVPMMVVWRHCFLGISSNTNWFSFVGALLIAFGILLLAVRKLVYSRPRSRRTRRWLGFLLI